MLVSRPEKTSLIENSDMISDYARRVQAKRTKVIFGQGMLSDGVNISAGLNSYVTVNSSSDNYAFATHYPAFTNTRDFNYNDGRGRVVSFRGDDLKLFNYSFHSYHQSPSHSAGLDLNIIRVSTLSNRIEWISNGVSQVFESESISEGYFVKSE